MSDHATPFGVDGLRMLESGIQFMQSRGYFMALTAANSVGGNPPSTVVITGGGKKGPRGGNLPHIPVDLLHAINEALNPSNEGSTFKRESIQKILENDPVSAIESLIKRCDLEGIEKIKAVIGPLLFPEGIKKAKASTTPKEVVKVSFDESTFKDWQQKLQALDEKTRKLIGEIEAQATEASRDNIGIIDITAASTVERKQQASSKLDGYIPSYNAAVESQKELKAAQLELQTLKKSVIDTLKEFSKQNKYRFEHLTELFKVSAEEHGLLKPKAELGYEPLATRLYGSTAVKVPGTQKEKYIPQKETISEASKPTVDQTNFSMYFATLHEKYRGYELFTKTVEKHLAKVAGCRKAILETNPEPASNKKTAEELRKQYEPLHDECIDMLAMFTQYTEELASLEKHFSKVIDEQHADVQNNRVRLMTIMKGLYEENKKLDQKLKETKAKNFKVFTLDTTELHDMVK